LSRTEEYLRRAEEAAAAASPFPDVKAQYLDIARDWRALAGQVSGRQPKAGEPGPR